MTAFTIPGPLTPETPFERMDFWNWAKGQPREKVCAFEYLAHLGFVVGFHRITPEQLQCLEYAADTFHRTMPHYQHELTFSQIFTPAECGGFYVVGCSGRFSLVNAAFRSALVNSGWIYEVTPESTYFEVINGRVFAKYQQIIGSRAVCFFKEGE
jgi:hypothetical protein